MRSQGVKTNNQQSDWLSSYPQLDTFEAGISIDRHILQYVVLSLGSQPAVAISPALIEDIWYDRLPIIE